MSYTSSPRELVSFSACGATIQVPLVAPHGRRPSPDVACLIGFSTVFFLRRFDGPVVVRFGLLCPLAQRRNVLFLFNRFEGLFTFAPAKLNAKRHLRLSKHPAVSGPFPAVRDHALSQPERPNIWFLTGAICGVSVTTVQSAFTSTHRRHNHSAVFFESEGHLRHQVPQRPECPTHITRPAAPHRVHDCVVTITAR